MHVTQLNMHVIRNPLFCVIDATVIRTQKIGHNEKKNGGGEVIEHLLAHLDRVAIL